MYFININITEHVFRVNLKMKKPTLCWRFTWIVFIKLRGNVHNCFATQNVNLIYHDVLCDKVF